MSTHDLGKLSTDNEIHKQHKKRTKKIKAQLQQQIEFYFGNANLQKDRFMKQEISKHPEGYVAISTIASFNRMKQITDDIKLVVKAMKMSSMLEVSEDEAMVRRKTPVPEPTNVDAETIYVERLPPYADHDWVKEIFSKYGKVLYVSIPRFKHTGDIKGFAFVEFESAKEAQEAVQMFNKGGKNKQEIEPEEKSENVLSTDQLSEQHKISRGKRKRSLSESEVDTQQKHTERKRKRTISDSEDTEQHGDIKQKHRDLKRKAQESEPKDNGHGKSAGEEEGKDKKSKKNVRWEKAKEQTNADKETDEVKTSIVGRKRSHEDPAGNEEDVEHKRQRMSDKSEESGEDETTESSKKHKKRKRKKKEKKETRLPHLRVISKLEWLELKKEYKNLQREAMNKLKNQLQAKSADDTKQNEDQANRQSQNLDAVTAKGKNKNTKSQNSQEQSVDVKKLPYMPGVVLKFHCKALGMTKKELRDKFSSYSPVAYLDLAEGSDEGHVRFHTAENCASVLKAMSSPEDELKVEKLTEEAEKAYWDKINADRIIRFNSKREKKRGTEKVARKAEALQLQRQSHIRFDENEGKGET